MIAHDIQTINCQELKSRMEHNPTLILIDVRELHEWEQIHILEALHIPKDDLAQSIESQVSDKTQPIYLHCRSGVRSLYSAACLLEKGYQEVYSIDGGILEWSLLGYPTAQIPTPYLEEAGV